jgi:hypothetical protein
MRKPGSFLEAKETVVEEGIHHWGKRRNPPLGEKRRKETTLEKKRRKETTLEKKRRKESALREKASQCLWAATMASWHTKKCSLN